jgi:hypothetical protein
VFGGKRTCSRQASGISENGTEAGMESLEQFQQNRRVIEDFTSRTLAAISCEFGRLVYVAMLRDLATGRYRHQGLEALYSDESVHQALNFCHEELLQRVLETPLEEQQRDLERCFSGMDAPAENVAARWLEGEFYRLLVPLGAPSYLRDLFCSNLRILLGLTVAEAASSPRAA